MDYDAYDALLHYIFREVGHHPSISHPDLIPFLDARRSMVQAISREHACRRLSSHSAREIPRFPI